MQTVMTLVLVPFWVLLGEFDKAFFGIFDRDSFLHNSAVLSIRSFSTLRLLSYLAGRSLEWHLNHLLKDRSQIFLPLTQA